MRTLPLHVAILSGCMLLVSALSLPGCLINQAQYDESWENLPAECGDEDYTPPENRPDPCVDEEEE